MVVFVSGGQTCEGTIVVRSRAAEFCNLRIFSVHNGRRFCPIDRLIQSNRYLLDILRPCITLPEHHDGDCKPFLLVANRDPVSGVCQVDRCFALGEIKSNGRLQKIIIAEVEIVPLLMPLLGQQITFRRFCLYDAVENIGLIGIAAADHQFTVVIRRVGCNWIAGSNTVFDLENAEFGAGEQFARFLIHLDEGELRFLISVVNDDVNTVGFRFNIKCLRRSFRIGSALANHAIILGFYMDLFGQIPRFLILFDHTVCIKS